jgi:N-acylneuraminate cytidylyltransferase
MDNMVTRNRLAIVPARGASKRLPGKNLIDFFGKPMLAWSIDAATKSGRFDRVIVSTEDESIAAAARAHGADVPFLRERHFDDHSTISDVTIHALHQLREKLNETYSTTVMLQATCPLRNAADVVSALDAFDAGAADFQMSCYEFHWANPWWAFRRDERGEAQWLFPESIGVRSQDLPRAFGLTGAICVAKTEALLAAGTFYGPGQRFEPISWSSAVDIDSAEDLEFAKAVYLVRHHHNA